MGLSSRLKSRRFRRVPLASSTGHDWLHALAGCCPSPVIGKAVSARFVGGATSNGLHVGATLWYFRDLRRVESFYFEQGQRVQDGRARALDNTPHLEGVWSTTV